MSARAKLYDKYKKSDIFNISADICLEDHQPKGRNIKTSLQKNQNDVIQTINIKRPINNRKYNVRNHESDIFNLNKSFDAPRRNRLNRNLPNKSTCFDPMKNDAQFSKEIKEYTLKKRGKKTEYKPDKYYRDKDASEIFYNQYYDKKRNPIVYDLDKSSKNILPKMNINNEKNEKNEKELFVERKKQMRNNFTKGFFDQRNINEKMKLEKETEKAEKDHKYYKSKGFTYKKNNRTNDNKFVEPEKYPGNSSKITKQIQLQSTIFTDSNENNKMGHSVDKIKERIKKVKKKDDDEKKQPKRTYQNKEVLKKINQDTDIDRNIWGVVHTKWEGSNLDWRNSDTEKIFSRNNKKMERDKSADDINASPFQRRMKQLEDSGNRDIITESIKEKRKYTKNSFIEKQNYFSNIDKIDEILTDIPEIKYDKKKKILWNQNTVGLNGETEIDDTVKNYKKFHKNTFKKEVKKPTAKIMSKDGEINRNKKKNINKNFNDTKSYDDYTIHDFVLSYDSKVKKGDNNFDKFSENDVKLLLSKKGIHAYDIIKNQFDNGKYNVIKFKVRENEGENVLNEKIKELENDLSKKEYKICIERKVTKEPKKNLKNVVNVPGVKTAIFVDNNGNKSKDKKNERLQIKNNTKFSKEYNLVDHKYKK